MIYCAGLELHALSSPTETRYALDINYITACNYSRLSSLLRMTTDLVEFALRYYNECSLS